MKFEKNTPHVAIPAIHAGGGGSVAHVTRQYANRLGQWATVSLISGSFNNETADCVQKILIRPREANYLRRFCHVPNEYFFCRSATGKLIEVHQARPISFLLSRHHSLISIAGSQLKRKFGVPSILMPPGDIFKRPKGTFDPLLTIFYKIVTKRAYKCADIIIASSPYMKSIALSHGVKDKNIFLVPMGISPQDIGFPDVPPPKNESSFFKQPFKLLYVGRLSTEKGIDVLLRACLKLKNEMSIEDSFTLDVVGMGPMEKKLKEYVSRKGLQSIVFFRDQVPRNQLGVWYRKSHLLCMPSIDEAYGLVAMEALLSGTPVVGSNVGGIAFIVDNGKNGLLVEPESPDELAIAIKKLMHNQKMLCALSKASITLVIDRFSWEGSSRKLELIIRRYLDRPCSN